MVRREYTSKGYVVKRFQAAYDSLTCGVAGFFAEKIDGFVDCHLENIVDVTVAVSHVQDVAFEAFSMACLTFYGDVGKELHFYGNESFAFAVLAPAAFRVERKCRGRESHLL